MKVLPSLFVYIFPNNILCHSHFSSLSNCNEKMCNLSENWRKNTKN